MKKKIPFIIAMLVLCICNLQAQTKVSYPEIGKPCPDFVLSDVSDYSSKRVSLSDLKGKPVILDFWQRGCLACIQSFPKLNDLHKQYHDKVALICVGEEDKENMIRPLFARLKKKNNYEFPFAFDSTFVHRMVHRSYPHCIWINKDGIVTAITTSADLSPEKIENFINGKPFSFFDMSYAGFHKNQLPKSTPVIFDDVQYLFKSELIKWTYGMPRSRNYKIDLLIGDIKNNLTFETFYSPLKELYKLAYFGFTTISDISIYQDPVLEMADTSAFIATSAGNTNGFYCYSLTCAPQFAKKENMMFMMQKDLEKFFPYKANMEFRKMPCYELRIIDKKKVTLLKDVGKPMRTINTYTERQETGIPIERALFLIGNQLKKNFHVINGTGITGKVNLILKADMWDYSDVRSKLNMQGLDLVPFEKTMKVLVIKDRN